MSIRCIAIDDEPFALGVIEEYCTRIDFLHLEKTFSSAIDAISFIKTNPVDLIFLDIEMREMTGLKLMEMVNELPMIILTTAYDQYAVKSYEYEVLDYLLKPISFDRFIKAALRALDESEKKQIKIPDTPAAIEGEYIFAKSGYTKVRIKFSDIYYIEGQRDFLLIRTNKEKIMANLTFSQLEPVLPPSHFIRAHKSYVVAIDKIEKIERFRLHILDSIIPIGEYYKNEFMKVIKKRSV